MIFQKAQNQNESAKYTVFVNGTKLSHISSSNLPKGINPHNFVLKRIGGYDYPMKGYIKFVKIYDSAVEEYEVTQSGVITPKKVIGEITTNMSSPWFKKDATIIPEACILIDLIFSEYESLSIKEIRVTVGGKTENGKSSVLNGLLSCPKGTYVEYFTEGHLVHSQTKTPETKNVQYGNITIKVTDSPGFLDSEGQVKDQQQMREMVLNNRKTTYHCVLFCVPISFKFGLDEQACLSAFETIFGEKMIDHLIIVLTKRDHIPQNQVVEVEKVGKRKLRDF